MNGVKQYGMFREFYKYYYRLTCALALLYYTVLEAALVCGTALIETSVLLVSSFISCSLEVISRMSKLRFIRSNLE